MAKNLVIVESPAKAGTIQKYLGADFAVMASYGHIADLPKKGMGIDIANDFAPTYEIADEKKRVVRELKAAAKQADKVRIATDEDREGEAIGRHVCRSLGLDENTTARIVFHEITKSAITHAITHPRTIDLHLVNAQQARRILDRIVGFEVSPVLWRKIRTGLSAGRVQSVAVRILVEREREIRDFVPQKYYKTTATFSAPSGSFSAEYTKKLSQESDVQSLLSTRSGQRAVIMDVIAKEGKKTPSAPFTTSSLQQTASQKMGYSPKRTMQLAQKLYEAGLITYMRTDSPTISAEARTNARAWIIANHGPSYAYEREYSAKKASAQEAHECIRPTDFSREIAGADASQQKLYQLIRRRAVASQMATARLDKTEIHCGLPGDTLDDPHFLAKGEVVVFPGFLAVYPENDAKDSPLLPSCTAGDHYAYDRIESMEQFSKPAARYTEASLIKKLEELGIGRPSTYAPTIETVQKRGYVVKEDRQGTMRSHDCLILEKTTITKQTIQKAEGTEKGKLFPTDTGVVVTDFLCEHMPEIVDYGFTAQVEEEFDTIASGTQGWKEMLHTFYDRFHPLVAKTLEEAERASGERILGKDPKTGLTVLVRLGRFGPMVQIGAPDELPEGKKPQYASIMSPLSIETITLAEAMPLFALPREIGEYEGVMMTASKGRFGPYVKRGDLFVSIPVGMDPFTIDQPTAAELVAGKIESDKTKILLTFTHDSVKCQIIRGRWGYYLAYGKQSIKLPKTKPAEEYTEQDCVSLIAQFGTPQKSGSSTKSSIAAGKKPTKKATTTKKITKKTTKPKVSKK